MEYVGLMCRFVLAFVFLMASIPKLRARDDFVRAVRNYRLLPGRLNEPVAIWLPRVELVVALALGLGVGTAVVAGAAGALLVAFAGAVSVNLARGRRIDCGCATAPSPRTIGWGLVTRDLALAGMAIAVVAADPGVLDIASSGPQDAASPTEGDAVAIVMLAALAVLAGLLISGWTALRSAMRASSGSAVGAP
jgi:Methylamine utilisation protein MauE